MSVTVQTGNSVAIQAGNRVIITAPGPQGPPGSGGGGTPGGANTQVQFNDGGSFGGDAGMTYNKATDTLSATNLAVSGLSTLNHIHGSLAGNLYVHIKNTSGVTIAKGTPVYATGSVGVSGEIEVAAADYTNSAKMPAIGITDAQLSANAEGNAVVVGEITELATNSYAINQELFVGTAGLLGALPTTGEAQSIAVVSRVHASTGIIVVNAQARLNAALRALANNVGSGLTALNASNITSGSLADAYIASAATWNAKQNAGAYITALTGDVTASGPGSVAATLANTPVTPGSYTSANITVDSKGRVTAAANGSGGAGDMTKAVYDSQNLSLISGLQGTGPVGVGGGIGGSLDMSGGNSGLTPNAPGAGSGGSGGRVWTHGGNGYTSDPSGTDYSGGLGGEINTSGTDATDSASGGNGGFINTSASGSDDGGYIDTSGGGGSIDTKGTGSIGLGGPLTRTTLIGSATANRTITLPNVTGTLITTGDTGSVTNAMLAGSISLTTKVSGTLPVANGGTGQTTQTAAFDALAPTTTKGDLIVHNGTDNVRVPVGTDGHSLVADSTQASGVKWAAVSSGAMVLLASATASNSASITFDNEFDAALYCEYALKFQGVQPSTDNVSCRIQLRSATPSDITDLHRNNEGFNRIEASGTGNTANVGTTAGWQTSNWGTTDTNRRGSMEMQIIPIAGQWTHMRFSLYTYTRSTIGQYHITGAGACEGTTTPAGVKIYMSSGNISSGTFQLYGILK